MAKGQSYFTSKTIGKYTKSAKDATDDSKSWFGKLVSKLRKPSNVSVVRGTLLKDPELEPVKSFKVGHMYTYFYDPKHEKTLPFYDRFPLIISVGPAKGGFYGINLHYLPHKLRAKLFDALLSITNNSKMDDSTKFKLSYKLLSSISTMRYFEPCFKHYLTSHISSRIVKVPAEHWEKALFMPTEHFQKADNAAVWSASRKRVS
jgi:hypothetical protein